MAPDSRLLLHQALQTLFPGQPIELTALPEERPWSRTYAARVQPYGAVYVKGTPRSIPEALTTARLAAACPDLVPVLLSPDLLPAADWHWFVTTHAGACDRLELTPDQACRAAFALGVLQRSVRQDTFLETHLPSCLPEEMQQIAVTASGRLMQQEDVTLRARAGAIADDLMHLAPAFRTLSEHLACLPPTCVHGDFWPGNIALQGDHIRIIDWGEAVWGAGGASIWNMLYASRASLTYAAPVIWDAYSRGWQRPVGQAYIDAARVAFFVTLLAVDRQKAMDDAWMQATLGTLKNVIHGLEQVR